SSRDMALRLQHGRDLGERMRIALESTLQKGQPALLIGTDAPGIDVAYLARAAHDLQSRDAVFGPAEDGGYVLVGLSRSVNAFDGIAWSTPNVMCQTRERLATANVRWSELPPLFDIDTVEDLMRWRRDASTLAVASS
ncbi:MAG TPA: TIGR04282 family arsenosugar biosynthesis glycosyltransferase, partial [Casimicrobiaceae bacterium]|nr:TIGR04282 family arsenosugar biosynthesis glycosyltransferase [Casimicrobiaceae bacterium]